MSVNEIIRAWKDEEFLAGLPNHDLNIPPSPVGIAEAPSSHQGTAFESINICTKLECTNFIGCGRKYCD